MEYGCLLSMRRRRVFGKGVTACCFFAGAHAALDLGLQILAEVFRNDAGRRQFPEVRNCELWKIRKNRGQRRRRVADKGEADVVSDGPLAMASNGGNHGSGELFAGERSQDLGLRHVW